jgi:hypothetical protein
MTLKRGLALPGQLIVSWFISGALLTGGYLVAYGTLTEKISYYGILYTVGGLYLLGGIFGFIAGGAVGMFGRPLEMRMKEAFSDQLHGILYIFGFGALGFVLAGWIGFTYLALHTMNPIHLAFVSTAWLVGASVISYAVQRGIQAVGNWGERIVNIKLKKIRIVVEDID